LFAAGLLLTVLGFAAFDALYRQRAVPIKREWQRRWISTFCWAINLKIEHHGTPIAGALMVSNHISWLDIAVLGSLVPGSFVSKHEVAAWPIVGIMGRRVETLFIHRQDRGHARQIAEQMVWRLKQRQTLIVFPEGTTTSGREVLKFGSALLQAACYAQAPIQPVALQYLGASATFAPFIGDDAFVPHLFTILKAPETRARLTFCAPLPQELANARRAAADCCRQQIIKTLGLIEQESQYRVATA